MISSWDGAKGTVLIGSGEDYCFHPLLGPRDGSRTVSPTADRKSSAHLVD